MNKWSGSVYGELQRERMSSCRTKKEPVAWHGSLVHWLIGSRICVLAAFSTLAHPHPRYPGNMLDAALFDGE